MFRIGLGFDIHSTIEGDSICLGGIQIPAPFSLAGHSDADVLLHALTDAILGALGEKDIGHHFPNNKKENQDRESRFFLEHTKNIMKTQGYSIVNIDLNVICEKPRLDKHRLDIEENIARLLEIHADQVNLKAKTNEGLDSLGEGRGVSAQAIVLIRSDFYQ